MEAERGIKMGGGYRCKNAKLVITNQHIEKSDVNRIMVT